jgi:hypothetical protein
VTRSLARYPVMDSLLKPHKEWRGKLLTDLSDVLVSMEATDTHTFSICTLQDSDRNKIMDAVHSKIENLARAQIIWKAASESVFQGQAVDASLQLLRNEILPQSIDRRSELLGSLHDEFEKALTTWDVFNDCTGLVLIIWRAVLP